MNHINCPSISHNMDRCLSFFSFVVVLAYLLTAAAVGSHATSPSEAYWQKVLPNTPMPSAIRDFFNLDLMDEKTGTTIDVRKVKPKGGVNVNTGHKGKPVVIHDINPKLLGCVDDAYPVDQLRDQKVKIFFLKKDLHTGAKMNLIFPKAINNRSTLPRGSLSGPPLDGKKLPEILNKFSIEPKSPDAKEIKETLQECTEPASKGEDRYCTTSIESMIDFAVSKIGTDVQVLVTNVEKGTSNQVYTIAPGVQRIRKSVACHPRTYVYPVYYCHETLTTSAYVVPLIGTDGSKVKAVAVCYEDTSSWNPKHISFQLLKVKPGSVPICHFLAQDHIVWVQKITGPFSI